MFPIMQPSGSWCASPQDDTPLWKTVNLDYSLLNELCDVQYPRLMTKLRRQSEEYARQRLAEAPPATPSPASSPSSSSNGVATEQQQKTTAGQPSAGLAQQSIHMNARVEALAAAIQELAELKCYMSSVLERVRNNLLAYALSEEFNEQDLVKVLQPAAVRAYLYHVADLLGKTKPTDPYTPFNVTLLNLEQTINLVREDRAHLPLRSK